MRLKCVVFLLVGKCTLCPRFEEAARSLHVERMV